MSQDIVELLLRLAPNCEWVTERTAMREAATLITTLTAERDAYKLSAEYESGDPDAGDRIRRIIAKAEASRALVQSMREDFVALRGLVDPLEITDRVMAIRRTVDAALSRSEV